MQQFLRRLWYLIRRLRLEADLTEELDFHRAMKQRELEERGLGPAGAAFATRRSLGSIALAQNHARDIWIWPWLQDLFQDLRYAVRLLSKNIGFTTVAALTLALGIGANTAVFTVVDQLLLRPPPFKDADRLRWIYDVNSSLGFSVSDQTPASPGNFVDWRESRSFDHMVAWRNWFFSVAGPESQNVVAEQVRGVTVSPSFFAMVGVQAALGRTFHPDEEEPGRDRVVVMSDGLWRRRFGADPGIIGKTVLIDGRPFSIVGVLPADFYFLQQDFEMWMPFTIDGNARSQRATHSIVVLTRLAPGVTPSAAQSDLDRIAGDLQRTHPETNARWTAGLQSVFPLNKELRPGLRILVAAVACLLLISCVNVANLLLVRAGAREREMALRAAIGASRGRLVRQLVVESALLSAIGTGVGVLAAIGGLRLMRPFIHQVQVSGPLTLTVDTRVLLYAAGTALVTLMAFGLWPALYTSRTDRLRVSGASGRTLTGRVLSAIEIAASLMLLVGAALLVQSLWNLQRVDPGFRPERLLTMQVWLPETTYTDSSRVAGFSREVLRRLDQFPEVRAAAFVNTRPFQGWSLGATANIPGRTPQKPGGDLADPIVGYRVISPDYLAALGVPLIRGRGFADNDGPATAPVALINETMARRFWPGADPVGQSVRVRPLGAVASAPWWPDQMTDTFTIVGVIGDVRESQLRDQVEPGVYLSYLQSPSRYLHLLVRTESQSATIASLVQREIRAVDPDLGVYDVRTMDDVLGQAVAEPRFNSLLLWAFATVALLLSGVGVYGVTSYAVAQRTREFAIRMAIGASSRSVFQMVTREGLTVAAIGVGMGLGGALLLGRTLRGLLYGVAASDPVVLLGAAGVILVMAVAACGRPAWRAARVEPMTVLRTE